MKFIAHVLTLGLMIGACYSQPTTASPDPCAPVTEDLREQVASLTVRVNSGLEREQDQARRVQVLEGEVEVNLDLRIEAEDERDELRRTVVRLQADLSEALNTESETRVEYVDRVVEVEVPVEVERIVYRDRPTPRRERTREPNDDFTPAVEGGPPRSRMSQAFAMQIICPDRVLTKTRITCRAANAANLDIQWLVEYPNGRSYEGTGQRVRFDSGTSGNNSLVYVDAYIRDPQGNVATRDSRLIGEAVVVVDDRPGFWR